MRFRMISSATLRVRWNATVPGRQWSVLKEKQDFEELVSRERSATRTQIDQVKQYIKSTGQYRFT